MARIRTIKPEFFMHDGLAELDPLTRILFIGIWTIADKAGRLADRPKRIKAEVLPYDDVDIESMLSDLEQAGHIERYSVEGEAYIQVTGWHKHQNVSKSRENESRIPANNKHASSPAETAATRERRVNDACMTRESHSSFTQGKEGKGKERECLSLTSPEGIQEARPDVDQAHTELSISAKELDDLIDRFGERNAEVLLEAVRLDHANGKPVGSLYALAMKYGRYRVDKGQMKPPSTRKPARSCSNPDCSDGWVLPDGSNAAIPCPDCSRQAVTA